MSSNKKIDKKTVVTFGNLIKEDLIQAYFLPSLPSSYSQENKFYNDNKYLAFNYPPKSYIFYNMFWPFMSFPVAGDEVPILTDHPPPPFLKHHWKTWLPDFPEARVKTVDEGLKDDVQIVTTGALQEIQASKHSVDPDVLYRLQLKSTIPHIGVPCPKHMAEDNVTFPCMVKVDMSCAGNGNRVASNPNELSAILREIRLECGWDGNVVFQEMIEGVQEVISVMYYLYKSGNIFWLGTSSAGFKGFSWSSAVVDWNKQHAYKMLLYDQFSVPIKNYLHKQGYFGFVNFEVLSTDRGFYLVDLNPRVSGTTAHLLLASYMAEFGLDHSSIVSKEIIKTSAKKVVEMANRINMMAKEGKIVILSVADVGTSQSQSRISVFARSPQSTEVLLQKLKDYCLKNADA